MSDWTRTADIAIIGGGIVGLSTGYYLSRRKKRGIVLLERDQLAQASTGLCVGGVRQQFSHPSNVKLSQETVRLFKEFEGSFQTDIGFKQVGYLFLAQKQSTWQEFRDSAAQQKQLGVPVECLTPDEIKLRWPYLNTEDLQGGTFCQEDGYADPYLTAMAFAGKARHNGLRILEQTEVTGFSTRGGKVTGLKTSRGDLSVPVILNAAGAWGGGISRLAGRELPVLPYRRQVFMTHPLSAPPPPVPMILDSDTLFYLRGYEPGLIFGMSDRAEPSSFNTSVDRAFLERVTMAAVHRVPDLEDAGVLRGWAGLYAITPDENAILGPVPRIEGLYAAIGFSGHGFQHAPPVGRILSELILDGRSGFDLSPYRADRFGHVSSKAENRVI